MGKIMLGDSVIYRHMTLATLTSWLPNVDKKFTRKVSEGEMILQSVPHRGYPNDQLYSFASGLQATVMYRSSLSGTRSKLAWILGNVAVERLVTREGDNTLGTDGDMRAFVYAPQAEKRKGNRETFELVKGQWSRLDKVMELLSLDDRKILANDKPIERRVLLVDSIIEELYALYRSALENGRITAPEMERSSNLSLATMSTG